jgi:predicted ester cyclase
VQAETADQPAGMTSILRRYAHAFVNAHDFAVCREVMAPEYVLHVGGDTCRGRDAEYIPAVRQQFDQFPTLCFSVHDLVTDGTFAALLFSESGTSLRYPGCQAAWIGVSVYRREGDRLAECWVEQDYYGRRKQLSSGIAAPLRTVSLDPWGTVARAPSQQTAGLVENWLDSTTSWPPAEGDWNPGSPGERLQLDINDYTLNVMFTAGDRAAFNATVRGVYRGGLADLPTGTEVETYIAALLTTHHGRIVSAVGVDNRLAVQRQLRRLSRS